MTRCFQLIFLLITLLLGCNTTQSGEHAEIDISEAYNLHAWSGEADLHPTTPWLILFYSPEISCTTCKAKALNQLVNFSQKNKGLDYLFVTTEQDDYNLRQVKRIGKVDFPILIEPYPGFLGLAPTIGLFLIDNNSGKIVSKYYPTPDERSLPDAFYLSIKKTLE